MEANDIGGSNTDTYYERFGNQLRPRSVIRPLDGAMGRKKDNGEPAPFDAHTAKVDTRARQQIPQINTVMSKSNKALVRSRT